MTKYLLKNNGEIKYMEKSHAEFFLRKTSEIAKNVDFKSLEKLVDELVSLKKREGRLFLLGIGGSAANCSHAVNDFRKICNIEAYTPVDNVSELTARANDEGWDTIFSSWLKGSRINNKDAVFVFSVGGGSLEKNISTNIVKALKLCKEEGVKIFGIVGRDGGYTKEVGDVVVNVPVDDPKMITPHTEAFQGVLWHCLVSHPKLKEHVCKWESTEEISSN